MPTTFANTIDGNDIFAKRAECDAAGNDLSTTYATKSELPTIVGLTAGANVTITEGNNGITIAATDTTYSAGTGLSLSGTTFSNADPLPAHTSTESGKVLGVDSNGDLGWVNQSGGGGTTYTAGDGIDITSDVISADVDGTTIGIDSSTKKIKLLSTIPSVDQTYSAASTNAQSGTAVAGAIAGKEDAFDVGTGLEMDTSGTTPTLQVEAPVDIVAGPGIVIDNPDGNTLRVSMAADYDEVTLWEGTPTTVAAAVNGLTLSESPFNFERIMVYWVPWNYTTNSTNRQENIIMSKVTTAMTHIGGIYEWTSSGTMFLFSLDAHVDSGKFYTDYIRYFQVGQWTVYENGNDSYITKIVGINRISGGN